MPLSRLKHLNTKECLWVYVLRILKDGPVHGYAIRQEIKNRFGFQPGTMTAYKVLYLLNRKGYVKHTMIGRKKQYAITSSGKRTLEQASDFYQALGKLLRR